MSKRNLGVLVVLALAAAVAWFLNADPLHRGSAGTGAVGDTGLVCHTYEEPKKEVAAAATVPVLKDTKAPAYKVLKVTDGDTITIAKDGQTTIRFLGMDAPEKSSTRYDHPEYYGEEAYEHARQLIDESGGEVRVTYDKSTKDKYGRDLAYIWLKDGRMLNAIMVADGFAGYYQGSPKPQYADTFLALARAARSAGKGMWAHCR